MADLVMNFLEKALPTVGMVAGGAIGGLVDPFGGEVIGGALGSALGKAGENAATGQKVTSGVMGSAAGGAFGALGGSLAGSFLEGAAPEIAGATGVFGKTMAGAIKGSVTGGAGSTAGAVAQGEPITGKNLTMNFLQGAAIGGVTGGVLGGGAEALKSARRLNQVGGINNPIDDDTAQKAAEEQDPTKVEKILQPETGPVVSKDVAPAVATTSKGDPEIVKSIVQNDINKKISPATTPSPAPTPLPPTTPVSDINTPQQVAGQASAAEENFMNPPSETPTPEIASTKVSKLGTMSEMGDILNTGGTTDEALYHYMTKVPGANMSDAQNALDQTIQSAGVDKSKINASLNPQSDKVSFAPVKEGDDMGAQLNGRYAGEKLGQNGAPAYEAMQALDPSDRELTRYLRGKNAQQVEDIIKQAKDPAAFRTYVNAAKNYNDYAQAGGAQLGQPLPYRVNYGGRTAYEPPEGLPEAGPKGAANPTTPAYTQQRYFNTHEEALAAGYTPRYDDPLEELKNDINQRGYNQTQLALAKGYEDAHPGQVQLLNDNTPLKAGYHQLLVPGGEHIAMPSSIADPINNRIMTSTPGKILGKYDTINAAGKQLELGGGTFHGFNTMGAFAGQQLSSGKLFTDPGALGKVVSNFFSDRNMEKYIADNSDASVNPSGGVDTNHSVSDGAKAAGLNIKNTSIDLDNPGREGLAGKIANIPGLKQIHQAVFDRQIPSMMLETFKQKTAGLDIFGSADDRLQAEKIARGINKEFGVTDHDLAGMTSRQFKAAGRVLLAPGYQEGVIHTLMTALDPRSLGTAEGLLARQAVIGKALVMGGLATAGAVAGGDFQGMTPKQVAMGIMNKAINPSFTIAGYKVSTPATFISDVAKPVEESVASAKQGKGIAAGAEDFASSHLAFAPSKIEEFATNKNYEGNAIYGTDYYGRPIPATNVAQNLASGVLPIPLAQTSQAATGAQSWQAALANEVGFNAGPSSNLDYAPVAAQTYVQQMEGTPNVPSSVLKANTDFAKALGSLNVSRTKIVAKAEAAYIAKDTSKMQSIMSSYNNKLLTALKPLEQNGESKNVTPYMLELLRQQTITYKDMTNNAAYATKTNPTAYGVPIAALASVPTPSNNANTLINNTANGI
jgi:hypothetical protein